MKLIINRVRFAEELLGELHFAFSNTGLTDIRRSENPVVRLTAIYARLSFFFLTVLFHYLDVRAALTVAEGEHS